MSGLNAGCSADHLIDDNGEHAVMQEGDAIEHPVNYRKYSDVFSSAGMPDSDFISVLKSRDTDLVINVAPPDAHGSLQDEKRLVHVAGMQYVNIPVIWKEPTQADVDRFLALMQQHSDARIFLHCQMNMRASAFAFLHRVINLREDPDNAAADMYDVWKPNSTWAALLNSALRQRNIAYVVEESE